MTKAKVTLEQEAANIAKVIELRKTGKTRLQILDLTSFQDRFIRQHMKGVQVEAKPVKQTQLSIAASQAYTLAIRPQGCKDYELRAIAKDVYGTKRDEERGTVTAAYTSDTLYNVKKRVIELAQGQTTADGEPVNPQFVMDWVCDERPAASRVALEAAALELSTRFDDMLTAFMEEFMVEPESDSLSMTEAQVKQRYAARRHILKLALPEVAMNGEPLSVLLKRSERLTDDLEATQDLPVVQTPIKYYNTSVNANESVLACFEADFAHGETGDIDPFLDATEEDVFADVDVGCVRNEYYAGVDSVLESTYTPSPTQNNGGDDHFPAFENVRPTSRGANDYEHEQRAA